MRRPHRATTLATLRFLSVMAVAILLAACGSSSATLPPAPQSTATAGTTATPTPTASASSFPTIAAMALPLGDGHVGSTPQAGWVDSCVTQFPPRGGASGNDPWIQGTTWDSSKKIAVGGSVAWPQASYSTHVSGSQRTITTNDLPIGLPTGIFPIRQSDPAYQYDRNPNAIAPQSYHFTLPAQPTLAASPSCLDLGPIGVLTDGVLLFDALDAQGRDGVAHEVQDSCDGHPQMNGAYHNHDISSCLLKKATGSATLVGYTLDGFGIYVERDASGHLPTDANLDACHGRTSVVPWDGKQVSMYHYDATVEYPYTIGCYMGTPVARHP